jgi:hypothetical protein
MTTEPKTKLEDAPSEPAPPAPTEPTPTVTVESIRAALRRAAPGADDLNEDLRAAVELSDGSATFRLR